MKLIFIQITICCLFLNWAYAFPGKGDYARYEAPYEGSNVIIEKTILEDNQEEDYFLVENKITYKDEIIQHSFVQDPKRNILNPTKIQSMLNHCVEREGARGTFVIKDQTVEVCETYNEDSQLTQMVGMVPFGIIRFQIYLEEEDFLDFYLVDFKDSHK